MKPKQTYLKRSKRSFRTKKGFVGLTTTKPFYCLCEPIHLYLEPIHLYLEPNRIGLLVTIFVKN